ncbi:MAG: DUF2513 domain-containing protein [Oscillospiraceae bacterium]|nr:DUF2513 domain-containing protein [Oscillospiraceae bacterium]
MKIDYSCARDVLLTLEECLALEELPGTNGGFQYNCVELSDLYEAEKLKKYDRMVVAYTLMMLHEAEYIDANVIDADNAILRIRCNDITYEGHKFLDSVRSETVWKELLKKGAKAGLSFTFEILKEAAAAYISSKL